MPAKVERADRMGGEISDWVQLVCRLLELPSDGVLLHRGWIARTITYLAGASAMAFGRSVAFSSTGWSEVLKRSDDGLLLVAHELVHLEQYRALGRLRFLLAYVGEYLAGRRRGEGHRLAYRNISFEREARVGAARARQILAAGALLRGAGASRSSERA